LGSVLPFLSDAENNNMSVIIFNPNERNDPSTGEKIREFTSMEKHCLWVWENIIKKYSPSKEIYIVAHSMGGYCTVDLVNQFKDDLNNGLIRKIAFTDSVHGSRCRILDKKTLANLQKVTRELN
jgi:predicted alpha/beta hydrolase family esterase